jgi:ribonuclease P protein component
MSDEADLSAQQSRAQAPPRLPLALGDGRRPQGAGGTPGTRPQQALGLIPSPPETIRRRADFLAANATASRAPMPGFVLLVRKRDDGSDAMRVGYTVTKKVGNAVVRNRMKRRLRALARELLPAAGVAGADHILIGRDGGIARDFGDLRRELGKALAKVQAGKGQPPRLHSPKVGSKAKR